MTYASRSNGKTTYYHAEILSNGAGVTPSPEQPEAWEKRFEVSMKDYMNEKLFSRIGASTYAIGAYALGHVSDYWFLILVFFFAPLLSYWSDSTKQSTKPSPYYKISNTPMETPDTEVEKIIQILDVKLEGLFNDAVRQCLRFVRKEQTEEEMKSELKSLNNEGLEHIRRAISSRDTYWKERVRKEVEGMKRAGEKTLLPMMSQQGRDNYFYNLALDTLLENLTKGE